MRISLAVLICIMAAPAFADPFPVAVPAEYRRLAVREGVLTTIRNATQARMARDKLLSLNPNEPMVARCRQAAAQYQQFVI